MFFFGGGGRLGCGVVNRGHVAPGTRAGVEVRRGSSLSVRAPGFVEVGTWVDREEGSSLTGGQVSEREVVGWNVAYSGWNPGGWMDGIVDGWNGWMEPRHPVDGMEEDDEEEQFLKGEAAWMRF
jgi:hypothetical protein